MNIFVVLTLLAVPALGARLQPVPEILSEGYIINGRDVAIESFPHQGSLRYFRSHSCGCALLGGRWVLTAAHCIGGGSPSYYTVAFGSSNRLSGTVYSVSNIITHPEYNGRQSGFPNDIALLKLSKSVTENTQVKRIKMASPSDGDFGGNSCYITGWGRTQTGGQGGLPTPLQGAIVGVLSPQQCKQRWYSTDADKHVCIGGAGAAGSCNGDSGGPLTCQVNGQNVLVGVTSWGINGCYTSYPSVYTRVSNYKFWVEQYTGRL